MSVSVFIVDNGLIFSQCMFPISGRSEGCSRVVRYACMGVRYGGIFVGQSSGDATGLRVCLHGARCGGIFFEIGAAGDASSSLARPMGITQLTHT